MFNGKISDKKIREIFFKRKNEIIPTTGKYIFNSQEEVIIFIQEKRGEQLYSSVINANFEVNEITEEHLFKKGRPETDYYRRVKLFGAGLEIVETTGILVGIDTVTDIEKGIIYYEMIGIDSKNPEQIIRVKLSEVNKNGKVYFTVFGVSGGAPVPATSSSDRRPGRITTSDT